MKTPFASNIDGFIRCFPTSIQKKLDQIRKAVRKMAPQATEAISYGIPTFRLNGVLLHFSAYDTHIGFYPGPGAIDAFGEACKPYRTGKGTLQFSLTGPLPMGLIRDIIRYRIEQQKLKSKKKEIVCAKGHRFIRTSSCRACPKCADHTKKTDGYPKSLAAPARRALAAAGIRKPSDLNGWTMEDLSLLHGIGPNALAVLRTWRQNRGDR